MIRLLFRLLRRLVGRRATSSDAARHAALILVAGNTGAEIGGLTGRDATYIHEAAHASMRLALGDDPAEMEIHITVEGGVVRYGLGVGVDASSVIRTEASDKSKIARINAALADWGLASLNVEEICREARTILCRHWILVATIAWRLEQQFIREGQAHIGPDALTGIWRCYELRTKKRRLAKCSNLSEAKTKSS